MSRRAWPDALWEAVREGARGTLRLLAVLALSSACSRPQADPPRIVADPAKSSPQPDAASAPSGAASVADVASVAGPSPSAPAVEPPCSAHADCALESSSGACRAGKGPRKVDGGERFCACVAGVCRPEVVAPVACKTTSDCSWLEAPWRPAAASSVPRPHPPVVPCKTGERDVVCNAGTCVLRAWKC